MNPTFLFNKLFWKVQPSVTAGATANAGAGGVTMASSSFDVNSIVRHCPQLFLSFKGKSAVVVYS
jgi:hypothetical protein